MVSKSWFSSDELLHLPALGINDNLKKRRGIAEKIIRKAKSPELVHKHLDLGKARTNSLLSQNANSNPPCVRQYLFRWMPWLCQVFLPLVHSWLYTTMVLSFSAVYYFVLIVYCVAACIVLGYTKSPSPSPEAGMLTWRFFQYPSVFEYGWNLESYEWKNPKIKLEGINRSKTKKNSFPLFLWRIQIPSPFPKLSFSCIVRVWHGVWWIFGTDLTSSLVILEKCEQPWHGGFPFWANGGQLLLQDAREQKLRLAWFNDSPGFDGLQNIKSSNPKC